MELVMKNALSPQIHLAVQPAFRSGAFRSARQPSKRDARYTSVSMPSVLRVRSNNGTSEHVSRILPTMNPPKAIGYCAITTLLALYIVGLMSNGVLPHIVQTLPLWFPIVLGLRQREIAKWASLPCFIIWLLLMTLIWLFLLGWAKVISGHFTRIEIVLTLVVGAASLAGLLIGSRWRTSSNRRRALSTAAIFATLQLVALRIAFSRRSRRTDKSGGRPTGGGPARSRRKQPFFDAQKDIENDPSVLEALVRNSALRCCGLRARRTTERHERYPSSDGRGVSANTRWRIIGKFSRQSRQRSRHRCLQHYEELSMLNPEVTQLSF